MFIRRLAGAVTRRSPTTNAGLSLLGQASQQLSSLIMTLLAAMVLSVAEYGLYALVIVIVEFAILFVHSGFFSFFVAAKTDEARLVPTMFWTILTIGFCTGVALFLLANPLSLTFEDEGLAPLLIVLAFLQPLGAVIAWASAWMIRSERIRKYYILLCQGNFLSLIIGMALLLLWPSVYALIAYRIARVLINFMLFIRACPIPRNLTFDRELFWEASRFSRGLYGARVAEFLSNFGADLLLAFFFSTTESGLYRIASRLAVAATDIVALPLRMFATKTFAGTARSGGPISQNFADFFTAGLLFIGGILIVLLTLGEAVVEGLFQPEFLGALSVMQLLALRAVALWPQQLLEPLLIARHQTSIVMFHNVVWLVVSLICLITFAPMGIHSLARSQVIVAIATSFAAVLVLRRWGGIELRSSGLKALRAVLYLIGYGAAVTVVWHWLSYLSDDAVWPLFIGVFASFVIAGFALLLAVKSRVLNPTVFASH